MTGGSEILEIVGDWFWWDVGVIGSGIDSGGEGLVGNEVNV